MKEAWLAASVIILVLTFAMYGKITQSSNCDLTTITTESGAVLTIEVANSFPKRLKGLSGRESLGKSDGMLFIFPRNEIHSFWMKDTHFPLDIIWIENETIGEVATLEADSPSKTPAHTPTVKANRVLELAGGKANEYKLMPGQTIKIPQNVCAPTS